MGMQIYAPRAILPPHRVMTEDERHGFRIACECFATWGRQLVNESVKLGGPVIALPPMHEMERVGRKIEFMAQALDLTIGTRGY
jgi:hypothetical protein